jgi:hypothetical protein
MMTRMTLLALTGLLSLPVVSLGAQTQMGMEQEDEAMNGSATDEFNTGEMNRQMPPEARIRDPFDPRSFSVTPEREEEEGEHGRIERIMGRSMEDERSRDLGTQDRFRKPDQPLGKERADDLQRTEDMHREDAGDLGAQGAFRGSAEGSFRESEDAARPEDMTRKQDRSFSESEDMNRQDEMKRRQDRNFRGSEDMGRDQERDTLGRPAEPGMEGEASGDVGAQGSFRNDTRQHEGADATGGAAGSTGRMEGAERPLGETQRSPAAGGSFGGSAGGSMGGSVGGR